MTPPGHPRDELQDLLDGRLDPVRRADVDAHLAVCPTCRRELEAVGRTKRILGETLASSGLPAALPGRIAAALDAEDARPRLIGRGVARLRRVSQWRLLAAAAAVAVLVLLLWPRSARDPLAEAATAFERHRSAELALDAATSDPATLEAFFAGRALGFPLRVFDFSMMGYRLAGGRVYDVRGRSGALAAYRGPRDGPLVCLMYEGTLAELPAGAVPHEHAGIRFLVYRRDGVTLVFWEEGAVVCVLIADGDSDAAVQLAHAKAIKV